MAEWENDQRERCVLRNKLTELWNDKEKYDAVIMPFVPCVAPRKLKSNNIISMFSTSFFANIMNLPAGIVPIRLLEEDE